MRTSVRRPSGGSWDSRIVGRPDALGTPVALPADDDGTAAGADAGAAAGADVEKPGAAVVVPCGPAAGGAPPGAMKRLKTARAATASPSSSVPTVQRLRMPDPPKIMCGRC